MKKLLFRSYLKQKLMLLFILLTSALAQAQSNTSKESEYRNSPLWITMMNDPNENYFETVKAFRIFFTDRFLPEEPWEKMQEGADSFEKEVGLETGNENRREKEREKEREKRKQKPNSPNYAAEVRAFRSWFYSVQPWVQSDGSIVTPDEQQRIIDAQHKELKEEELKNGKN